MRSYHIHIRIDALLEIDEETFKKEWQKVFLKEDKTQYTWKNFRKELLKLKEKDYKLIPGFGCNNFDPFEKGCLGHNNQQEVK